MQPKINLNKLILYGLGGLSLVMALSFMFSGKKPKRQETEAPAADDLTPQQKEAQAVKRSLTPERAAELAQKSAAKRRANKAAKEAAKTKTEAAA